MKHSELQLFSKGGKLTAEDIDALKSNPENTTSNKLLYYKLNENTETELDEELDSLRQMEPKSITADKDDKSDDSGSDESIDSGNDSDVNVSEAGQSTSVQHNSKYTVLKENRDSELHHKLSEILNKMDNKKPSLDERHELNKTANGKNVLEPYPGSSSEDEEDEDADLLQSSKNKDILFADNYKNSESESEDDSDEEDIQDDDNEQSEDENENEETEDHSDNEENESGSENEGDEEDLEIKWKDSLAKKAQDAFVNRLSRTKNVMKIVYGELS